MMRLSEAAAMLGVPFAGADVEVLRVSTDSRTIQPGDLFIALRGEKFDGGAFAAQALKQGAAGVVLEHAQAPEIGHAIRVDDTRLAAVRQLELQHALQLRADVRIVDRDRHLDAV